MVIMNLNPGFGETWVQTLYLLTISDVIHESLGDLSEPPFPHP